MGAKKKAAAGAKPVAEPVAAGDCVPGTVEIEKKVGKPLRPSQCEKFLRKAVASAFPEIVGGFVGEAKRGGCQHLKAAVDIVKTTSARRVRAPRKGPAGLLMEKYGGEFGDLPEDHPLRIADSL